MELLQKNGFNRIYLLTCVVVFIVVCLRAFFIPISHDEASTFFFYVQSGQYLPYKSHVYTNNHILNSALATICYRVAGSHPFALRLPNIAAFVFLCWGVFRLFRHLKNSSSKITLATFFILTLGFLDFFELCRGYGLSMGFIIFGLSFLQDYFATRKFWYYLVFSVFWQLALAANLTLVMLSLLFLIFVIVFQLRHNLFFKIKNLLILALHLKVLYSWIKLSFYYKRNGMLDSGWGEDYWIVSFKSLIFLVFGSDALWLQALIVVLFFIVLFYALYTFYKQKITFDTVYQPRLFYLVLLVLLITGFYLQKKLLDVNYPENRTALFFYIFFALSFTFFLDEISRNISRIFAGAFAAVSLLYFLASFNLTSFTHYFYHVIPNDICTYLEKEQTKSKQPLTIGGNRDRETNFAFMNYRKGSPLNLMDDPKRMYMNCDYYFAGMYEKPFYRFFYDEVAYDPYWQRVLLKRKYPIQRKQLPDLQSKISVWKGSDMFVEFLNFKRPALTSLNCIEADIELNFKKVPAPFNAFVVLQVADLDGNNIYYKKIPLNWIANDLTGQTRRFKLTTGPLPEKFKDIIVYFWNIDKKELELEVKQLKIYELNAPGINSSIPANYYPFVKKIIKKELI